MKIKAQKYKASLYKVGIYFDGKQIVILLRYNRILIYIQK